MDTFIVKQGRKLKIGYTTGTCATAAAKGATRALLTGSFVDAVTIEVPAGLSFDIALIQKELELETASCAVRKYSGDDPDVTDGMLIYAKVEKIERNCVVDNRRVVIDGGLGIGRVTRKGLACEVGMAAINPTPRKMIEKAVVEELENAGYRGGIKVIIWAPEGEERAKKTFNSRLGILGGISILGTSGVVEPMSEDALIETIKIEMNQHDRDKILFASPGNYGVDFAQNTFGLDMNDSVKYSNYIGEFLDHAVYCGFSKVLLIGHVGKLIKLAAGVMNTHSKVADGRQEVMITHSAMEGVGPEVLHKMMDAVSVDEMHEMLLETGRAQAVYESIGERIQFHLDYRVRHALEIEFIGFSNQYGLLLESAGARQLITEIKNQK
ncbi:MAG: cobalt-precorrin-5B (C(1))-methyltransferase CbiD [Eubacteriales bacterium]